MKRLRIIVADDESIIRMGLRTMLSTLGHEALLAAKLATFLQGQKEIVMTA